MVPFSKVTLPHLFLPVPRRDTHSDAHQATSHWGERAGGVAFVSTFRVSNVTPTGCPWSQLSLLRCRHCVCIRVGTITLPLRYRTLVRRRIPVDTSVCISHVLAGLSSARRPCSCRARSRLCPPAPRGMAFSSPRLGALGEGPLLPLRPILQWREAGDRIANSDFGGLLHRTKSPRGSWGY